MFSTPLYYDRKTITNYEAHDILQFADSAPRNEKARFLVSLTLPLSLWMQIYTPYDKEKTAVLKHAITKHLHDIPHTADLQKALSTLYWAKTKSLLAFAEAVAFCRWAPNPCMQKDVVISLNLSWCTICSIIIYTVYHSYFPRFVHTFVFHCQSFKKVTPFPLK